MQLEMFSLLGELADQTPCEVRHEWGAKITFAFGWRNGKIDWQNDRGWVLRFEEADWRVDGPEGFICNRGDDDYFNSVTRFYNHKWGALQKMAFIGELMDIELTFESGAVVKAITTREVSDEIQWQLQSPYGARLRVYGGGSWTIHYGGETTPTFFWSPESRKLNLEHEPTPHMTQ
jgi:hypothetical protein